MDNRYDYEVATVHIGEKTAQKYIQYLGIKGKHNKPLKGDKVDTIQLHDLSKPINGNSYQKPRVTCKLCQSQNTRKFGFYKSIQNRIELAIGADTKHKQGFSI